MEHNKSLSVFKALGIISIVASHAAEYIAVGKFVYLYHVALFFMIAGYTFNEKYLESAGLFLKKKIIRLYIPFVLYGISFVLLHNFFVQIGWLKYDFNSKLPIVAYDTMTIFTKSVKVLGMFLWKEPLLAPLWFLFGLISGFMVFYSGTWIALKIGKGNYRNVQLGILATFFFLGVVGAVLNKYHLFTRPLVIGGLIYLGSVYRIFESRLKPNLWIAIGVFALFAILAYKQYYINIGGMMLGNPLFFLPIILLGFYMVMTFSRYIVSHEGFLVKSLDYIGKNTLTIMALQYTAFKLIMYLQITVHSLPSKYIAYYPAIPEHQWIWWPFYTIVGVIIPLGFAWLYDYFLVFVKRK